MAEATRATINIPQILAVVVVGFLAVRWWMSKPSTPGGSNASSRRGQQIDVTKVEQIAAMFPQLDRRTIAWDLHRNGGSVSATTERVLSGRGLDNPPPSFQPNLPSPEAQAPTIGVHAKPNSRKQQDDLITRYNLQNRVGGKGKEAEPSEEQKRNAWSSDKAARAEGLKRRREEMILAARRKMEEKGGAA